MQVVWHPHITVFGRDITDIRQLVVLHEPGLVAHLNVDDAGAVIQNLPLTMAWSAGDDSIVINASLAPDAVTSAAVLIAVLAPIASRVKAAPHAEFQQLAVLAGMFSLDPPAVELVI